MSNLERLTYRNSPSTMKFAVRTIVLSLLFGCAFFIIIPLTAKLDEPLEKNLTVRSVPEMIIRKKDEKKKVHEEKVRKVEKKKKVKPEISMPQITPPPAVPVNLKLSPVMSEISISVDNVIKPNLDFKVEKIKTVADKSPVKPPVENVQTPAVANGNKPVIDYNSIFEQGEVDQVARRIKGRQPAYPFKARRRNITGRIVISGVIDKNGTVTRIFIKESDPKGYFEESCLNAVKEFRYEPAVVNGKAVMQRMLFKFNFGLTE